ncbi:MAG: transposase [Candidatus Eremiobacteraeota bacterium]|nr:transposase [Candidatus Eremiobacteraeota bacterium]MCW5867363.1 transposase [Candidatus Eremiobacteraeota bacterium]
MSIEAAAVAKHSTRSKKKRVVADHDSAWKAALLVYLPKFFEFFFPELHARIDWSKKARFLDRELQALAPKSRGRTGKRLVDLLVELRWLADDSPLLVLVHIEVQAQKVSDLAERLFFYHVRITEVHRKKLCTLVILADQHPAWRPGRYYQEFAGSSVDFKFPVIKLLDFLPRLEELESSSNPFALLVAATLHGHACRPDSKERLERKFNLLEKLYALKLSRREIVDFLIMVDHCLVLSPSLQRELDRRVEKLEKMKMMPLLSNRERRALRKGREEERARTRKAEEQAAQERERAAQERERAEQAEAELARVRAELEAVRRSEGG